MTPLDKALGVALLLAAVYALARYCFASNGGPDEDR